MAEHDKKNIKQMIIGVWDINFGPRYYCSKNNYQTLPNLKSDWEVQCKTIDDLVKDVSLYLAIEEVPYETASNNDFYINCATPWFPGREFADFELQYFREQLKKGLVALHEKKHLP